MASKDCDRLQSLHIRAVGLGLRDPRSIADLAQESGIPFYWLSRFLAGAYRAPNVNRVQHFYEFLTGNPLIKDE